nr:DUF2267 domain-containing protein [Amycolatopsis benzoatilytica]
MVMRKEVIPGPRTGSAAQSRETVLSVLESLLRCLPLPEQARLGVRPRYPGRTSEQSALLLEISLNTRRSPRAARCLVRAVYTALGQTSPELAGRLRAGVSPEVLALLGGTRQPCTWSRETPPRCARRRMAGARPRRPHRNQAGLDSPKPGWQRPLTQSA